MKRIVIALFLSAAVICSCSQGKELRHGKPSDELVKAFDDFWAGAREEKLDIHSAMVLQHGKILTEKLTDPDTAHILNSCTKTFTATAVGLAVSEGLLSLETRIIDIFPEFCPEHVSDTLSRMTVRHLLTMNSGHGKDPTPVSRTREDWVRAFLETPLEYEPGTCFCYNTLGSHILSAAVQKVTGQKIVDYLQPRLWEPLGIEKPHWEENPEGESIGGYGLYLRTEDLAKMGICLLGGGKYHGRQVIPADWVAQMSANQVPSVPSGINQFQTDRRPDLTPDNSDSLQGYGFQMWRCRHNGFRAAGAYAQFIICLPDKDAVVVITSHASKMQNVLNLVWDNILPVL